MIDEIDLNARKGQTITMKKDKAKLSVFEALASKDHDFMKTLMKEALQEVLEGEMTGCG